MAARFPMLRPAMEADFVLAWNGRHHADDIAHAFEISREQVFAAARRLKLRPRRNQRAEPRFHDVPDAELQAEMPSLCMTAAAIVARRYVGEAV